MRLYLTKGKANEKRVFDQLDRLYAANPLTSVLNYRYQSYVVNGAVCRYA